MLFHLYIPACMLCVYTFIYISQYDSRNETNVKQGEKNYLFLRAKRKMRAATNGGKPIRVLNNFIVGIAY